MADWTPSEFRDLEDVEYGAPSDEDIPRYDSGTDKLVMGPPQPVAPTGPAGGDLTGTYPDPEIADGVVDPAKIDASGAVGVQVLLSDGIGGADWADFPSVVPGGPAGGALDGTYPNPGLASTVAGNGLSEASDVLSVNVDGSTLELSGDALRVKDDGITAAKIAANAVGSSELADNAVDTNAIQANAVTAAKVAADVATQAELDAAAAAATAALAAHTGDTSDAHDASAISILDAANDFTATDVEGALAELQSDAEADAAALAAHLADTVDAHDASAISVLDTGGNFTATDVEGALAELADDVASGGPPTGSAGGVLDGTYPNPGLAAGVAGSGLAETANVLSVNVDGSTIEVSSDTLRVKDGGITSAKIADGTITTGDLAFDPATQAELDAHISDTSAAHAASAISIADAGNDFTATDVEGALDELQADAEADAAALAAHLADTSDAHDASAISVLDTNGDLTATDVEAALAEIIDMIETGTAPTGAAGGVLSGTYPNPGFAADMATQAELDAHLNDTSDAHDASAISILDAANDFTATDVEGALAELQTADEADEAALAAHLADTSDAHDASAISVLDTGGFYAATDVEGVLAELAIVDRTVTILVTDPAGDALTTGDGKAYWSVPAGMNGYDLVAVQAHVTTVSSSGLPTIQIANVTQAADMLTTKLSIDANEKDSKDAATPAVIDTGNDDIANGDEIRIDIDVAGTGAKGLIVHLTFRGAA